MESNNKRKKITIEMIARLYELSKQVYHTEISKNEAVEIILSEFDMNKNSALDYINNFKYMLNGEQYARALSCQGHRYYLENIKNDYNDEVFQKALIAVQKHINYYNTLGYGKLNKLQKMLNEFKVTE